MINQMLGELGIAAELFNFTFVRCVKGFVDIERIVFFPLEDELSKVLFEIFSASFGLTDLHAVAQRDDFEFHFIECAAAGIVVMGVVVNGIGEIDDTLRGDGFVDAVVERLRFQLIEDGIESFDDVLKAFGLPSKEPANKADDCVISFPLTFVAGDIVIAVQVIGKTVIVIDNRLHVC